MHKSLTPRLIPALLALAFSGVAGASGFQLLEQNASGLGNAYAGSAATAENASTIFYNPAGMTQLQDREISVGLNAITTSYKFQNNGSSSIGTLSGNGGDGGGTGLVPNAYMSWALNKDLYVGLGIGAPFGMATEYGNPWIGAAQSVKFDIKTINVNPSVAWRANEWLSLGFGLNYQTINAEYFKRYIVASATTQDLKLDDSGWGWNAGALFTLSPVTKVGVSYRSSIQYHTSGDVHMSTGAVLAAKADVKMPDTFILSVSHKLSNTWELLGDVSWTGWSSIPKLDIVTAAGTQSLNTDFKDTWRVAGGANYTLNDAWKLKFGIAYDQTPVKGASTRLVSLPDNDRLWLSTGVQWKVSKASTLDAGLTYLYLRDADISNNQATVNPLTNHGWVKGSFSDSAWIFGAQYSLAF
jgi:long-chain fatty acid transport protein